MGRERRVGGGVGAGGGVAADASNQQHYSTDGPGSRQPPLS